MTIAEEVAVDLSDWVVVGELLVDEGKVANGGVVGSQVLLATANSGQEGAGGRQQPPDKEPKPPPAPEPASPVVEASKPQEASDEAASPQLPFEPEGELSESLLPPPAVPVLASCREQAEDPDSVLLEWACSGVSGKRLRSLRSFRDLADDLADGHLTESLSPEDWCMSLVEDINDLVQVHAGREWEDICGARLTGGDGEGALSTVTSAALARRKGVSSGLARLFRERGESRRPLVQALASEYLRRYMRRSSEHSGEARPPRPARRVSVTFETRPFGMTPYRGETGDATVGYVVDKVNHNDPSKPASRLGVRAGWVGVCLDGTNVRELPLEQIQQLLKEATLPMTFEFEVPPKGLGAQPGSRKSQDGSRATSMSPPASPPCYPNPVPQKVVLEREDTSSATASPPASPPITAQGSSPKEDTSCQGGWDDPEW